MTVVELHNPTLTRWYALPIIINIKAGRSEVSNLTYEQQEKILLAATDIVKSRGLWEESPAQEKLSLAFALLFLERGVSRNRGEAPDQFRKAAS